MSIELSKNEYDFCGVCKSKHRLVVFKIKTPPYIEYFILCEECVKKSFKILRPDASDFFMNEKGFLEPFCVMDLPEDMKD